MNVIDMISYYLYKNERGATALEYGLIAGLVAVVIAVVLVTLGGQLASTFQKVVTCLKTPGSCVP